MITGENNPITATVVIVEVALEAAINVHRPFLVSVWMGVVLFEVASAAACTILFPASQTCETDRDVDHCHKTNDE